MISSGVGAREETADTPFGAEKAKAIAMAHTIVTLLPIKLSNFAIKPEGRKGRTPVSSEICDCPNVTIRLFGKLTERV